MSPTMSWLYLSFTLVQLSLYSRTGSSYRVSQSLVQRLKRQSSCTQLQWTCVNLECIPSNNVCDGTQDCSDGSDETHSACRSINISCPSFAFECAYGACIDKELKCNRRSDCADGSDEIGCQGTIEPTFSSRCESGKFQCTDGQCIDQFAICDVVKNCNDGSDETSSLCEHLICSPNNFQCKYGACLEQSKRCNNQLDCPDGSDEEGCDDSTLATNSDEDNPVTETVGACKVPNPSENKQFATHYCPTESRMCIKRPGDSVPHSTVVNITCDPEYYLLQGINTVGTTFLTICRDTVWNPSIPQCHKLCPSLRSLSVNFECWQGPTVISCKRPMLPGTIAHYSCKDFYENSDKHQIHNLKCNLDGKWSRELPNCTPRCGQSNLNNYKVQPHIVGGQISEAANFPWHAGLYHKKSKQWDCVCGGTLISTRIVLTAAHCVTEDCVGCKPPTMGSEEVMVALGKIYKDWAISESSESKRAVKEIHVHQDYVGSSLNFDHDIAVVVLKTEVQLNIYVMPACVDLDNVYGKKLSEDKTLTGYVAGWGNTKECSPRGNVCNNPTNKLIYAVTTISGFIDCFNASQTIRRFSAARLTTDKYCAGNGSESVTQQGDSGGGQTFVFDGLHYTYGIVSVKLKLEIADKIFYSFGAFTNVTKYMNWLKTHL